MRCHRRPQALGLVAARVCVPALLAALLSACASREPAVVLWPAANAGFVAPRNARVAVEGGDLVLDFRPVDAAVDLRFPRTRSPLTLHLRARIATPVVPTAFLSVKGTSRAEHGEIDDVSPWSAAAYTRIMTAATVAFALSRPPDGKTVDLWLPLSRHWARGLVHDHLRLSIPDAVVRVESAELCRTTPRTWLAWLSQELRAGGPVPLRSYPLAPRFPLGYEERTVAMRGFPTNFYALCALVAAAMAWQALRGIAALLGRSLSCAPFLRAVLFVLFALWALEGASTILERMAEYQRDRELYSGLSGADVRVERMGIESHGLAAAVDALAPRDARVKLVPSITGMETFSFASAIAPRKLDHEGALEPTDERSGCHDMSSMPDFVALPRSHWDCFLETTAVPIDAPCTVFPADAWEVPLTRPAAADAIALLDVPAGPGSDPPVVTVLDGSGRVVAPPSPAGRIWMVHLPPDCDLRLRVEAGRRPVTVAPPGVTARFIPEPYVETSSPPGVLVVRRSGATGRAEPVLPGEERRTRASDLPRLLLGFLLLFALGEGILRLAYRGEAGPSGLFRLALAWLLGAGSAAVVIDVMGASGLPHGRWILAMLAMLALLGFTLRRTREASQPARTPMSALDKAMAWIAGGLVAMTFAHAAIRPMIEWDALMAWGYRGHLFFHSGATRGVLETFERLRPGYGAYPPLVPLVEAYVAMAVGRWDDGFVTTPAAMAFGAMIALLFAAVRRRASSGLAGFVVVLGACSSMAMMMAVAGLADLPLAALFVAAVACLDRWDPATGRGDVIAAGLCCSLMALTKLEGGPLRLLILVLVVVRAFRHRSRGAIAVAIFLACAFLPELPWQLQCVRSGLLDSNVSAHDFSPARLRATVWILEPVLSSLARYLFVEGYGSETHWNATYLVLVALLLLGPRSLLRRNLLWTAALAFGLAGYVAIYLVTPWGVPHMLSSLDRLLLHLYPVAVVLAGRATACIQTQT